MFAVVCLLLALVGSWMGVYSLCLDPQFGMFMNDVMGFIQIEASQIDFSVNSSAFLCDSDGGPKCGLLGDSSEISVSIGENVLAKVLGLPEQVSVASLPKGQMGVVSGVTQSKAMDYRFGDPFSFADVFSLKTTKLRTSKIGPVKIDWVGANWHRDSFGQHPSIHVPSSSSSVSRVRFSQPVVVQSFELSMVHGITSCEVFMVGVREGKEQWRTRVDLASSTGGRSRRGRAPQPSLMGSDVFARWKANGSIYRSKVMYDEGDLGVWVSWSDGDQSFRGLTDGEIVSLVSGRTERLMSVDELVLYFVIEGRRFEGNRKFAADDYIKFVVKDFSVSATTAKSHLPLTILRGGGGMVFSDTVSPEAVMYTAEDMFAQGLRLVNSEETKKRFSASIQMTPPLQGPPTTEAVTVYTRQRRQSMRNLILFVLFLQGERDNSSANHVVDTLLSNISGELVRQFLSINDYFAAAIDNGNIRGGLYLSVRFQVWTKIHKQYQNILLSEEPRDGGEAKAVLTPKDIFEGYIACGDAGGRIHFTMNIAQVIMLRENLQRIVIEIKESNNGPKHYIGDAIYIPSLGMLYVPPSSRERNAGWIYPMTLFVTKAVNISGQAYGQSKHKVEVIGTGEYISCGAVFLESVKFTQPPELVTHVIPNNLREYLIKFNSILISLNADQSTPKPTIGIKLNQNSNTSIEIF